MRLRRALENIVNWISIILFGVMFVLIFGQIVLRSVFNAPTIWSEELARYIFIWVCFLGWIIAARRGTHLGVDVLLQLLPSPAQRVFHACIAVATLIFAGVLLWTGFSVVVTNTDVETVTLFFNFGVVYAIVPIAAILIAMYALRDLAAAIRGRTAQQPEQARL